jgi:hypothetical protein
LPRALKSIEQMPATEACFANALLAAFPPRGELSPPSIPFPSFNQLGVPPHETP